jgi:hypothetical protein
LGLRIIPKPLRIFGFPRACTRDTQVRRLGSYPRPCATI